MPASNATTSGGPNASSAIERGREAPDGDAGAVGRHRRQHHVRRGDPSGRRASATGLRRSARTPSGAEHALHQLFGLARGQLHGGPLQTAGPFDPHVAPGVHQHLGDGRVGQQGFERTQAVHARRHALDHVTPLGRRQQRRPHRQLAVGGPHGVGVAPGDHGVHLGRQPGQHLGRRVVGRRAHAAALTLRVSVRGRRPASSSPASTTRATDGS